MIGAAAPLRAVVVVPARDEAVRIGACLDALARQTVGRTAFAVVAVLDACRDDTGVVADETATRLGLDVRLVPGPGRGVGWARRVGMDLACELLLGDGGGRRDARGAHDGRGTVGGRGLIASTDADSRVAPDWLARQLEHVARGAQAIAGDIELDPLEAAALPSGVLERRRERAAQRLAGVRRVDPGAAHHHCAGASLALTAATYRRIGGIEPRAALEDAALEHRLAEHGVAVLRAGDVRVRTSARRDGRAPRGLAVDLDAAACDLG